MERRPLPRTSWAWVGLLLFALAVFAYVGWTTLVPVPSQAGIDAAYSLCGQELVEHGGRWGDGLWIVAHFVVLPHDGVKRGWVMVEKGRLVHYIPVETDGDVADLWRRVRGAAPEHLRGEQSEAYREFWR